MKAHKLFTRLIAGLALLAGISQAAASTITYYHNDLVGSPVAATSASGQVIWRESYRPYGERLKNEAAAASDDIWFTSRRQDSTGLVYMGARYYDPVVGRFMSIDPKGFDEADRHSHNRYAYAKNNPYGFIDPDGRSPVAAGRILFTAAYETAKALGAASIGSMLGIGLANILNNASNEQEKGDAKEPATGNQRGNRFPDRELPRDKHGNPVPDPEAEGPHTQLGQQEGRRGKYDQAREFDAAGKPVRDVDFTDHGRGPTHSNPHQHRYLPNASGGTPRRGPTEPLN